MKTRILSTLALGLFFWAGMAISPSTEKVTVGPTERWNIGCGNRDLCPPGYRCVWNRRYGDYQCIPKVNGN